MGFEVSSFPNYSKAELFSLVVACYFTDEEIEQANRFLAEGKSYQEAGSWLIEIAQADMRKRACCLTIPGGTILAFPPESNRLIDLSYISFQVRDVVHASFPPQGNLPIGKQSESEAVTLWGRRAPLESLTKTPGRKKPGTGPSRICFEIAESEGGEKCWRATSLGQSLGLCYQVRPLPHEECYFIELVHERSGSPVAAVILQSSWVDHQYVQQWVKRCLPLADWRESYQMILRRQPAQKGMRKRDVLRQSLEGMWQQQTRVAYQQRLFPEQREGFSSYEHHVFEQRPGKGKDEALGYEEDH